MCLLLKRTIFGGAYKVNSIKSIDTKTLFKELWCKDNRLLLVVNKIREIIFQQF